MGRGGAAVLRDKHSPDLERAKADQGILKDDLVIKNGKPRLSETLGEADRLLQRNATATSDNK